MKTMVRWGAMVAVAVITTHSAAIAATKTKADSEVGAESAFRAARAYTVRIQTRITTPFAEDEQGSFEGAGFLVDAQRRWIVTNAHVVGRSPSDVEIAFANEPFQPARKIYVDSFADVAVLEVDSLPQGRTAPVLDCSEEARIGEAVGVFGHPLGMYFTGTRGIVSNRTDQDGPDLIQIDATVNHGNSGGPVIALDSGHVVGIATSGVFADKSDRLNFATPVKDVCRILALLREGHSPSPPRMEFALLRNDEGSYTMNVARSYDSKRWPLEPNDRILAVLDHSVSTLTDFISALRGRSERVTLTIERHGHSMHVDVTPALQPLTTARRGVVLDGALIAPVSYDDDSNLREPWQLMVQSVEPGSAAEMMGLRSLDVLHSLDGRRFADLDSLYQYLSGRGEGHEARIVCHRSSPSQLFLFDYIVRDLPGRDVRRVGPEPVNVAAKRL